MSLFLEKKGVPRCECLDRSKFEYKRKVPRGHAPVNVSVEEPLEQVAIALSGGYAGHFYLQVPGKTQPARCDEKAMSLEFVPNNAGSLNIRGFGKNKYGNFEIAGTCSADLADLTMYVVFFFVVTVALS